ncbi:MAG: zinc ribbon domain-containing protein [Anaerolineaceae bacterium]|nr:zinc ribbon domain-containing protein [Anaerolineaceae bacterium]
MPVYTYRCDNCGVQFDRKQSFTDPLLKVCPDCGKKTLHKVYTPVGIVFKGSGFYATDHRSPSGQNKSKTSHEEKSSSSSASESSSSESSAKSSSESSDSKSTSPANTENK